MIEASIICDSVSPQGKRLTTFRLRYPKWIHGEFLTHRVISRNASSSRAVPTKKLIEEVLSDTLRACPVFWGKNQPGMQATEEFVGIARDNVENQWRMAAWDMATRAETMLNFGVHKQIVNRLLEPFSHINVVATATEWGNFFGLRLHKDAQPEMRALAIAMWEQYKAIKPQLLQPGGWHLPFVDDGDDEMLDSLGRKIEAENNIDLAKKIFLLSAQELAIRASVARCARVSYESFETGKRSAVEEDLKLYDRLLGAQPLHASPAEHQGTPDVWVTDDEAIRAYGEGTEPCPRIGWQHPEQHGNFIGFRQYRKLLPNEAIAPIPEEFR